MITTSTPGSFKKHAFFSPSLYDDCGVQSNSGHPYSFGVTSRIVGGQQAIPHSHPWQVLLNIRGRFCGGSLIVTRTRSSLFVLASVLNQRWLITAAHCVNG
jgi:secreted trypsin-like serine protease